LWRWTAPHPGWRPGARPGSASDWERDVGSVMYLTGEVAVFIDPLLPPDRDGFWRWADSQVGGLRVSVLTTIRWHSRDRAAFVERYGAVTSRARRHLPDGVQSFAVANAGETMYWLPAPRALVPGDRILGAPGGKLRVCPESWLRYLPARPSPGEVADALQPLLDLPIEQVLVSHGQPVLRDGAIALKRAIRASSSSPASHDHDGG
jgi:hypothetical protein